MKINSKHWFAGMVLVLFSWSLAGCGSSGDEAAGGGSGRASVEQVFNAGTELAIKADFPAMRDTAFYRLVEQKIEENMDEAARAESDRLEQKLKELTGLEGADVGAFAVGMGNLNAVGDDPSQVTLLAALALAKPVTVGQIEAAARFLAEENGATFPGKVVGDRLVFPAEGGMPSVEIKVVPDGGGSLVLLGDAASVAGGLSGPGRQAVPDLAKIKDGLVQGESGWVAMKLPDSAREGLKEMAANPPPMAPGLAALGTLESVSMAVGVSDALSFALAFNLADESSAAQVRDVIENQLITMIKMFAPMHFKEGVPPMINSLAAGVEGRRATFSLRLVPQDVEMMQAAAASALGGVLGAP